MKGQVKSSKYTGEERVRDSGSLFKRLAEITKKPSILNAEAVKSANKSVAHEVKTEFNVALTQILGIELKAGKSYSLAKKAEEYADKQPTVEKPKVTSEHSGYFSEFKREAEGQKKDSTSMVISQQLDSILAELRNLKNSSDELENVFKDVVVDQVPEKPGIYHLTFYEGFLKLVMKMRDKVEDGVVYAKLFRSRKAERSYSSMAKKGGTSYTMHHDRSVATQTG